MLSDAAEREVEHPARDRPIGQLVDEDEAPEDAVGARPVGRERLERNVAVGRDLRHADRVEPEGRRRQMLERVDVDLVFRVLDGRGHGLGRELEPIAAARDELVLGHPHDRGFELVGGLGRIGRGRDHVAARAIHRVGEGQRHRLAGDRSVEVAGLRDDPLDPRHPARRQDPDLATRRNHARCDLPGKAAEILVRAVDPLHRHAERLGDIRGDVERDVVEKFEQGRPVVPRHRFAARHDIVAGEARDRDRGPLADPGLVGEQPVIVADRGEYALVVIHHVHFGHRQRKAADAHQPGEIAMAPGLGEHALARVDQHHRRLGARRAGDHVARILLVAGGVGDDELALGAREIAVSDVDRDRLLAFGRETVDQQRKVDRAARGCLGPERGELVVRDLAGLVEQPPDQGRFAVVDAAAGDEAQQLLARGRIRERGSKIALLLLLLHAAGARVAVDRPPLPLRHGRGPHFRDDLFDARRVALDRPRQRIAAERPEPHLAQPGGVSPPRGMRSSSTIRISPSRSIVGRSAAK